VCACGVSSIDAVIVGRALYTGAVRLAEAIRVARGAHPPC
jgi:phosphoribosylformimino-5-aminoimidazole carboxamide ribonucleotide (ProFAR) isomerase